MQDIVFPNNNEEEFIDIGKKLGYTELILVYPLSSDFTIKKRFNRQDINIKIGVICSEKDIQKAKKLTDYVFVKSKENNQHTVEKNNNITLFELENQSKRDFIHHRASGLNQVLCSLIKKNKISVGFSFNSVLNSRNRSAIIGRIKQNIKLCRKYKLKTIFASFADDPYKLRNHKDIESFFNTI